MMPIDVSAEEVVIEMLRKLVPVARTISSRTFQISDGRGVRRRRSGVGGRMVIASPTRVLELSDHTLLAARVAPFILLPEGGAPMTPLTARNYVIHGHSSEDS
jgi:hypothetical protein